MSRRSADRDLQKFAFENGLRLDRDKSSVEPFEKQTETKYPVYMSWPLSPDKRQFAGSECCKFIHLPQAANPSCTTQNPHRLRKASNPYPADWPLSFPNLVAVTTKALKRVSRIDDQAAVFHDFIPLERRVISRD